MAEMKKQPKKNFSGGEKVLLIFLVILAVGIILLGFIQLSQRIKDPFADQVAQYNAQQMGQEASNTIEAADDLAALREKDTDGDGISDFEEAYVYGTSAYLADTDSDGYSDQEEIEASSDPLNVRSTPVNPNVENLESEILNLESGEEISGEVPLEEQISIEEIKDLLRQTGVSDDILSRIDDDTLRQLYQETVEETQINPAELK